MPSLFSSLLNSELHRQVLRLALPMVISNITIPLLGLVDAAVIGHLDSSWYLGGVALGSTMISVTFWLLGFLRMSTTGLTAQAVGAQDRQAIALVLIQGLLMALLFALVFLIVHGVVAQTVFGFSNASPEVKQYAAQYFSIRAWSAPAALANYVLLGWLLGTQDSKSPMWMVMIVNLANIVLDLLFVVVFDWKVQGAASASVISDYLGMGFGLWCVGRYWTRHQFVHWRTLLKKTLTGLSRFIKLNRDIFLRSLCLQAVFSFMTFRGAAFGDDIVAANAVLMSFLMTISYGMDGFAYAIEALVGKAVGGNNRLGLKQALLGTFFWSLLICFGLTLVFFFSGTTLINWLTDIESVRTTAYHYLPWLVVMPLISMWCFLLDGLFIGATKGKEMRNSMFFSLAGFFAVYLFLFSAGWQNHALWFSMLIFMALRGISLLWIFKQQWQAGYFFNINLRGV